MQYRSHTLRVFTALAFLAFAVVCYGRIFQLWGGAKSGMSLDQLGAKELYRAKVQVNDGSGDLTVYGWDDDFEDALAALGRTCFPNGGGMKVVGDGIGMGIARNGRTVARMILLKTSGQSVLFRLVQSPAEYELSEKKPSTRFMSELPPFPGSEPIFFLKNADTGTSVEISRTRSRAGTVSVSMDDALASAGWQCPFPGDGSTVGEGPVCRFYVRKKDMCCILATDMNDGTGTLVLAMHNRL
ncbi:MAG: hypothetical protein E4H02_09265 [Lentisphaerales bacterium]|jgi:hypothetical protein|nr:MAG: hypothetical protein E4H02_09265 [Lentisphaerales bacterium]